MLTPIKLDRKRNIKFTLNSLIEFERITGIKISEISENPSLEVVLALIYVGLKHEDEDLTMEKVGDLITMDKLQVVNSAIVKAINVAK